MLQTSQTNIRRQQLNNSDPSASSQYKTVNAYTQKPALEQILAIVIFITILSMHSVFITSATATLESPILWVLVSVTYGFLIAMVYDYLFITFKDPVDDLVLKVDKRYKEAELTRCQNCRVRVHIRSYHCQTCKRCVQRFDHHCKYLNNCIGGKNYTQFIRLLMNITFFCISIICASIWVFLAAQKDQNYKSSIVSQWGALATLVIAVIALAAVDSLLFFHFYLIFSLKITTIQYIRKGWQEEERQQERIKAQKRQLQEVTNT